MTVALRSTAERAGYRVDDLGRMRGAEQRIAKGGGRALELVPPPERLGAARPRIRPLRRIVVAPGRRLAGIFGIARLSAVEPVDRAERIVPGDGEAHARLLAGRDANAPRERAVLRLLPHLGRRARIVVTPLASAVRPWRIPASSGSGCRTIGRARGSRHARRRRHRS